MDKHFRFPKKFASYQKSFLFQWHYTLESSSVLIRCRLLAFPVPMLPEAPDSHAAPRAAAQAQIRLAPVRKGLVRRAAVAEPEVVRRLANLRLTWHIGVKPGARPGCRVVGQGSEGIPPRRRLGMVVARGAERAGMSRAIPYRGTPGVSDAAMRISREGVNTLRGGRCL